MSLASFAAVAPQRFVEDPWAYLPCSPILKYGRGEIIYDQNNPSSSIFLIMRGKVRTSRITEDGSEVIIDLCQPAEMFGEAALIGKADRNDVAIAFENTEVMTWTASEIEEISTKRPQLAIALMQLLVRRSGGFTSRIESLSVDNVARRLARALLRFSERIGSLEDDGSVQMISLTHAFLAQYVGTTREIITHYMNVFRRDGYLHYSPKSISVRKDALEDWLRQKGLEEKAVAHN